MKLVSVQVPFSVMEQDIAKAVQPAQELGVSYFIGPWIPPDEGLGLSDYRRRRNRMVFIETAVKSSLRGARWLTFLRRCPAAARGNHGLAADRNTA